MKGFVYLLEISIALILMITVMGTLSSFKSKENWERSDLVAIGNSIEKSLTNSDILDILNNNTSKIQNLKPPNIDFGIKISGISKTNISVGCIQYCDYVKNLTKPIYFNNRWVNFSVEQFTIDSTGIPSKYDAVIFVNYTDYTNQKNNITNYLNLGGVVIGINGTYSNTNTDFNNIFGLSSNGSASGNFNFTTYNPSKDEIEKYFIYLGFDINASNYMDANTRQGYWYIWGISRKVNITSTNTVSIENKSIDETGLQGLHLNDIFSIKNLTSNKFYAFKVDKIDWNNNLTVFQPLDIPFTFNDFSESNDVTGNYNILSLPSGQAEMTSNNNAVWISDFPWSDEYRVLVRNAIASRVKEWYIKSPDLSKEYVAVSSFHSLCCDMPETAELTLYLWYKI